MFMDIVFRPLPAVNRGTEQEQPSLIGVRDRNSFGVFIDDHLSVAECFDEMYEFLHQSYFPRVAFRPMYLTRPKTFTFSKGLEMVSFSTSGDGLRLSAKHRDQIRNWTMLRILLSKAPLCA